MALLRRGVLDMLGPGRAACSLHLDIDPRRRLWHAGGDQVRLNRNRPGRPTISPVATRVVALSESRMGRRVRGGPKEPRASCQGLQPCSDHNPGICCSQPSIHSRLVGAKAPGGLFEGIVGTAAFAQNSCFLIGRETAGLPFRSADGRIDRTSRDGVALETDWGAKPDGHGVSCPTRPR